MLEVGPTPTAGACVNVREVLRAGPAVVSWTVSRPGFGAGKDGRILS
jgi:hypothetical protein